MIESRDSELKTTREYWVCLYFIPDNLIICCHVWNALRALVESIVHSRYLAASFLQRTQKRHPIACHQSGVWGIFCEFIIWNWHRACPILGPNLNKVLARGFSFLLWSILCSMLCCIWPRYIEPKVWSPYFAYKMRLLRWYFTICIACVIWQGSQVLNICAKHDASPAIIKFMYDSITTMWSSPGGLHSWVGRWLTVSRCSTATGHVASFTKEVKPMGV